MPQEIAGGHGLQTFSSLGHRPLRVGGLELDELVKHESGQATLDQRLGRDKTVRDISDECRSALQSLVDRLPDGALRFLCVILGPLDEAYDRTDPLREIVGLCNSASQPRQLEMRVRVDNAWKDGHGPKINFSCRCHVTGP
jgi:hypothetical protein